jgi:hypothetical protein
MASSPIFTLTPQATGSYPTSSATPRILPHRLTLRGYQRASKAASYAPSQALYSGLSEAGTQSAYQAAFTSGKQGCPCFPYCAASQRAKLADANTLTRTATLTASNAASQTASESASDRACFRSRFRATVTQRASTSENRDTTGFRGENGSVPIFRRSNLDGCSWQAARSDADTATARRPTGRSPVVRVVHDFLNRLSHCPISGVKNASVSISSYCTRQ